MSNGKGNGGDPGVIDLEEVLGEWRERVFSGRGGGSGGGGGRRGGGPQVPPDAVFKLFQIGIVGLLALWALASAWYTVPPDSEALVLRFGKLVDQTKPGLHFKLPWGIDRVEKIPVERVLKQEFGFSTVSAGVQSQYTVTEDDRREAIMLTGDLNIANVEWIVQYKVRDPVAFNFKVRNVEETLHDASEAIMRRVVGDRSVTEVLTVGRTEISTQVEVELQELLTSYETGIEVVTVQLQDVRPPGPVEASFNEVNEAKQEKERMINEAWTGYNQAIPAAEGAAARLVAEAEGYATDRVNRSQGDAQRFNAVYEEYRKAKDVTRRRLYLETMNEIMPRVGRLLVLDKDADVTPFIDFGDPKQRAAAAGGK